MGLIRAALNSVSSTLGDQFKEFVTCPAIEKDVLIQRGIVNHGKGNSNPSEGIISNGSGIVVPKGMAMMIVDNGEVVEFTAEEGTYTFDKSSEPSIFTGELGKSIIDTIKTIGKRITYGGQTARDQRVYYVNTLVIAGNKFGSPQPKKITDEKYGMLEVDCVNACWQSDTSVGPYIKIDGIKYKTYIIMFIDDKSRLIMGYDIFFNDTAINMQKVFKTAIKTYGKPKKLFVDNGGPYDNKQLSLICASLGIYII